MIHDTYYAVALRCRHFWPYRSRFDRWLLYLRHAIFRAIDIMRIDIYRLLSPDVVYGDDEVARGLIDAGRCSSMPHMMKGDMGIHD